MTSIAFIMGVLPLATSRGVGSGGQNAIGWSVVGGVTSATVLAISRSRVLCCRLSSIGSEGTT
jgi:multidrug efflux pump subunit AcrB